MSDKLAMHYFILILLSFSTYALELKTQENTVLKFINKGELRVSEHCQKECQALKDYQTQWKTFKRKQGNPASEFCFHVGGIDKIVSHPNLDQDSVCVFKDGSYILSWDLWRKNTDTKK